jgi:hypothetical protein
MATGLVLERGGGHRPLVGVEGADRAGEASRVLRVGCFEQEVVAPDEERGESGVVDVELG